MTYRLNYFKQYLDAKKLRLALLALLLACSTLVITSKAEAADYPGGNASTFATNAGGWSATTEYEGICIQGITCPTVTASRETSGGVAGGTDGHLRVAVGGLLGTAATSRSIYTSPAFTYNTNADQISFAFSYKSDITDFISVAGNSVAITAQLLDASNNVVAVMHNQTLTQQDNWLRTNLAAVPLAAVKSGQQYRIRLITSFVNGVNVVPGATVDYDNVILRATRSSNGGNGNGNNNGNGNGNNNGTNPVTNKKVKKAVKKSVTRVAYRKNRLLVRAKCPKITKRPCRYIFTAMRNFRKPVSWKKRTGKIRVAKVRKRIPVRIKKQHRPFVERKAKQRGRLLFKIRYISGKRNVVLYKRLRLAYR